MVSSERLTANIPLVVDQSVTNEIGNSGSRIDLLKVSKDRLDRVLLPKRKAHLNITQREESMIR